MRLCEVWIQVGVVEVRIVIVAVLLVEEQQLEYYRSMKRDGEKEVGNE